jgi:hypothetical protein
MNSFSRALTLLIVGAGTTALVSACSGKTEDNTINVVPMIDASTSDAGPPDSGVIFPDTGIGHSDFSIARVVPANGPFSGGNIAVIRGAGLSEEATVRFGGRMVQPADLQLLDTRRLQVVVPAGDVGPADVTVELGTETVTLPAGYNYDALQLDPNRGSVAGGTFVTITGSGTHFEAGDVVTFGHSECMDIIVVSPTVITCRTPPLSSSTVDVTITHPADASTVIATEAYTYYDTSDPFGGGLGGGPVMGTMNITVLNASTGEPIDGVCVVLNDPTTSVYGQTTDAGGHVTFSSPDLLGPQTVTAAKDCFEKTTFVQADASSVTIFLVPLMDPRCGMGGEPPPGRSRNGSFVSGQLIWRGPNEYGPNPWANIPRPRSNEVKVSYVFATQETLDSPNPDPNTGGGVSRIVEGTVGDRGYPYRIFVAPGGMAVYALSGLENEETGEFIPYVMGIARNVLVGPGEEARNTNMIMNIPLDHAVSVTMNELPMSVPGGNPNRYRLRAAIDLGGEGLIVRTVQTKPLDVVRAAGRDRPFRLLSQPALFDALSDGRYLFEGGWYTGEYDSIPYTMVTRRGVADVAGTVELNGFLGIPAASSPAPGAQIPEDRILRWTADGAPSDLNIVLMTGGDGQPAWRQFIPGDVHEAPIPNTTVTATCGAPDYSGGFVQWGVYAVQIPGFDYNTFSYSYLNDQYWTGSAVDFFSALQ